MLELILISTSLTLDELVGELRPASRDRPTPALASLERFWANEIGTIDDRMKPELHVARFECEITKIRFRGLSKIPVLILGEDSEQVRQAISPFVAKTPATSLGFILCLTSAAHHFVLTASSLPPARFLVLSPEDVESLFRHTTPVERLRQLLLLQIPHHRLIPYSIAEPTEGAMFVGRHDELQMLMYEDQDFALCGPGGIGKTSLLRQMAWMLRRQRDSRYPRIVEVDLLTCPANLDLAARKIAMAVSPTKQADNVTCSELEKFLRKTKHWDSRFSDGPIDLIIDEVDEILSLDRRTHEGEHLYPLMRQLRFARLHGVIRLTISGRNETARVLNDPLNPFAFGHARHHGYGAQTRFKLLEIGSLGETDAHELLLRPLKDLGYPVDANQQMLRQKLSECGGIPIDVQSLGLDLANEAARTRRRELVS